MKKIILAIIIILITGQNVYATEVIKVVENNTIVWSTSDCNYTYQILGNQNYDFQYKKYTLVKIKYENFGWDYFHESWWKYRYLRLESSVGNIIKTIYTQKVPNTQNPYTFPLNETQYHLIDNTVDTTYKRIRQTYGGSADEKNTGTETMSICISDSLESLQNECYPIDYEPYCIEFEHMSLTLVQDNTWLHDLLYEKFEDGRDYWRIATTARVKDEAGQVVEGWLLPLLPTQTFIEYIGLQWPIRQHKSFWDINYKDADPIVPYEDRRFLMSDISFKNLYYVLAVSPDLNVSEEVKYTPDSLFFSFYPKLNIHRNTSFFIRLDDMIANKGLSMNYLEWPEPLQGSAKHFEDYNFSYFHCVDTTPGYYFDEEYFDEKGDEYDWSDFETDLDIEFPEGWDEPGGIPSVGVDDRINPGRIVNKMIDKFEEFNQAVMSKAPFGYLAMIFNQLEEFTEAMGSDDLPIIEIETSSLSLFDTDVGIDFHYFDIDNILSVIRMFSGWVFYAMLGIFFYREYRRLLEG